MLTQSWDSNSDLISNNPPTLTTKLAEIAEGRFRKYGLISYQHKYYLHHHLRKLGEPNAPGRITGKNSPPAKYLSLGPSTPPSGEKV